MGNPKGTLAKNEHLCGSVVGFLKTNNPAGYRQRNNSPKAFILHPLQRRSDITAVLRRQERSSFSEFLSYTAPVWPICGTRMSSTMCKSNILGCSFSGSKNKQTNKKQKKHSKNIFVIYLTYAFLFWLVLLGMFATS